MKHGRKLHGIAIVALALVGLVSVSARATLIGVVQKFPDVTTHYCNVDYDHTSGAFDVTGYDDGFSMAGETISNVFGVDTTFNLHAILDPSDGHVISGTVTINGTSPAFGLNSGLLISGNLVQLGFLNAGGDIFDYKFQVTGGDLAVAFQGYGGGILNAVTDGNGTAFNGSFGSSFHNANQFEGVGNVDTFPVPEPASLGLVVISTTALASRRRHHKSS